MSFPVCKQKGFGMFPFRNLFEFLPNFKAVIENGCPTRS